MYEKIESGVREKGGRERGGRDNACVWTIVPKHLGYFNFLTKYKGLPTILFIELIFIILYLHENTKTPCI